MFSSSWKYQVDLSKYASPGAYLDLSILRAFQWNLAHQHNRIAKAYFQHIFHTSSTFFWKWPCSFWYEALICFVENF